MPRYSSPPWRIVACAGCGFVYLQNAPRYSSLVHEFAFEKTFAQELDRRKTENPILFKLDHTTRWRLALSRRDKSAWYRRTFLPGRVLDIGCGGGTAVPEPFVPFGIEVSAELAKEAQAKVAPRGGRVIQAPALQGIAEFPDGYFSGVVLQSFLEHELNPKALLREVRRVLAEDGAAYVRVPHYGGANRRIMGPKWCGFRSPDHVNYFTVRSLRRMAEDCGLRLALLEPLTIPFGDNIKATLTRSKPA